MAGSVLVTGAAGFVGSHLVDLLCRGAVPVVAWHRPGGRPPARSSSSWDARPTRPENPVHWRSVDLLDRPAVTDAIAELRPSAIYHCAGAAHVGGSWKDTYGTFEINVLGTHAVIEAVRQAGVDARVLIPGSAMVYRQSTEAIAEDAPLGPASPYALSKLAQEMLGARFAQEDGHDVLIARSFNHLGPRQSLAYAASSFARQIAQIEAGQAEPVIVVGNLDTRRDLTDVRDTVRAYQLLMERGGSGRVYNVCSGRAYPVRDILEGLLAHARVSVSLRVDPARFRPHDSPVLLGDPSRIRRELGWEAEIPMERTLLDLLAHWREAAGRS